MSKVAQDLEKIELLQQKLGVKKGILLQKALSSTSPNDILKAQKVLEGVENREQSSKKSFILDPLDFNQAFGYKDKPFMMSYQTLKNMSKSPIINAIIKTRKNQIADFAEPQSDRYSTGFVIRKKQKFGQKQTEQAIEELNKIEEITEFILNCGVNENWENDDFETFIRKIVEDSLVYDQMTFEVVRDLKGKPYEFFATDASTYRVADSYNDDEYVGRERQQIKGYFPSYVQVYQGQIKNEFYPWELCFGIRNPSTSIYNVGYGVSELEELVTTITSMLWAEEYNRKFFSQGSAPKGLLKIKSGQVSEKQLSAFRQEWNAMIQGVSNSWKTPVVEGDIDWIDLQKNNRDMEYNQWMEFLIKISCAVYNIDPNEIGFNINSGNSKEIFESNNEGKLKHSKDKGLYPLLKFIQRKINKYIVNQLDPNYEFLFVGLNGMTLQEELEMDIKKSSSLYTVNEIRKSRGDDKIDGGDIILNPTFTQSKMMAEQAAQQGDMGSGEDDFDINPFLMDDEDVEEDDNPFLKSFLNNIKK